MSESTDVEVAVINIADSVIVRHLAAGVLGANTPLPLQALALSQTIAWDGLDDMGNAVTVPEGNLRLRVRAGLSVTLDKMAGGNPYFFAGYNGIVVDQQGNLLVKGAFGAVSFQVIRKYDGNGDYLGTVFPYPSSRPAAEISGFGVNNWENGRYSPKNANLYAPSFTNSIQGSLSFITALNELVLADYGVGRSRKFYKMNLDGSISNAAPFDIVTSPVINHDSWTDGGPGYFCPSPDGRSFYLSGVYQMSTATGMVSVDTGAWRDGILYKVDMNTGVASAFITLDSVPYDYTHRQYTLGPVYAGSGAYTCAAMHGVDVDDSGHVFVCDRLHNRVSVYDTNGVLLGGLAVKYPDVVAVNRSTGEIYAINRLVNAYGAGFLKLYKFPGWRSSPAPVCSLLISASLGEMQRDKPYFALSLSGSRPVLWLAYCTIGLQSFTDTGNGFVKGRDFRREISNGPLDYMTTNMGYDRLAVDRRRETVYFTNSFSDFFKIEDWSDPVVLPCSTAAGTRLMAGDFSITLDDQIYVRQDMSTNLTLGRYGFGFEGPIRRYSLDHYHAPIPFLNTGDNMLTVLEPYPGANWSRYAGGAGYGEHGFDVARDKRVAAMGMIGWTKYCVAMFADSGFKDSTLQDTVIYPMGWNGSGGYLGCGGVRFDSKGNLYIGAKIRPPEHVVPPGFSGDNGYDMGVGSVIRYPKGVKGSVVASTNSAPGSDKIYTEGLAPFSGAQGDCQCRAPRFEIDPYDRLVLPNAVTNQVTITDNNGNRILQVGEYGNFDQKGRLGTAASPAIPLAWPVAAGTSDNYLYVTDMVNTRIVRMKMNFALDNLPGVGHAGADASVGAIRESPLRLTAAPNPFNPAVTLTLSGKPASLKVYDAAGRLAADLSGKVGNGRVTWNAAGFASGVYMIVARQGKTVLTKKIIYSR